MPSSNCRILSVAALVLGVVLAWFTQAGMHRSELHLQTVWPQLRHLPEHDRDFLEKAALACALQSRSRTAAAVVACLRAGASALDRREPALGWRDAERRIEVLLSSTGQGRDAHHASGSRPAP